MDQRVAIVVPCFNEEASIEETLLRLKDVMEGVEDCRLIVVDEGSTDDTRQILTRFRSDPNIEIVKNENNRGYGAALKKAIRSSRARLIAIIDADLTYPETLLPTLIDLCEYNDMVVGVRPSSGTEHHSVRSIPKYLFRHYVQWMVRDKVPDFNSGLRVFRRELALKYFQLLPDGFSFTTTLTIALHLERYRIEYVPITYLKRVGESKIKPIRDTLKFSSLMFRTGIYFSPLRILTPLIFFTFTLAVGTLAYDVFVSGDIGDKTVLLFLLALNVLFLGVFADMVAKKP